MPTSSSLPAMRPTPPTARALLSVSDKTGLIEAAKALAAQDPYAKAGLFETVEIKPYNWVFNNPEA